MDHMGQQGISFLEQSPVGADVDMIFLCRWSNCSVDWSINRESPARNCPDSCCKSRFAISNFSCCRPKGSQRQSPHCKGAIA